MTVVQNILLFTPEARNSYETILLSLDNHLTGLDRRDKHLFIMRLERYFQNLYDGLKPVYGHRNDFQAFLERLVINMAKHYSERPDDLKELDFERDITPDWFQRETMLGYVFYVDRFAGTLKGIEEKSDYLQELGANYLHLMACLKARSGENDGGYAIEDYREVNPELGTIDELESLCSSLRARGMSVCVDLVLNHCAKEHAWARAARAGDKHYQDYFYMFSDRAMPDEYEKSLPEVFPDFAPGNFSYYPDMDKWVWTTFNEFQWDLNWSNPDVFIEITDIMFFLANKGVEVFRLDAVAFMWKRLGTNSQNQQEVHDLLQALRACSKITTPAVAHKAEAIVSPDDLIDYFGTGRRYGKVSNIAYHNSLMVQFWSALASRDTRLMTYTLREFPRTPASIAWGTYIRCHDDIGWAITDEDAAAVGLSGAGHRSFLSDYYAGLFPGTHARGEVFQYNPATGDRRISGSFASLAGLELALESGDERLIDLAIERILLGHTLIAGFGGIPLLYMGDELGLLNDYDYANHPDLAGDNRWVHRPFMDWEKAEKRHEVGTVEARIFEGTQRIFRMRKRTPHFNSSYETEIIDSGHPHVFSYIRSHPLGTLLALYNFTEQDQWFSAEHVYHHHITQPFDVLQQQFVDVMNGVIHLGPYQRFWLVEAPQD